MEQTRATIFFGLIITIVGIFCSLSNGSFDDFSILFGHSFMDLLDIISSKYMLPFGGMMTAIFILVRWGVPSFLSEFGGENLDSEKNRLVVTILCFIAAGVAGFILLNELIETITGNAIIG